MLSQYLSKGDVPKVFRTTVATGRLLLVDGEGEMERGAYDGLDEEDADEAGGFAFFRCIMAEC